MSAIEIRPLTRPEIFAYTHRGNLCCGAGGCNNGFVYLAVYQQSGRVERDLLCGTHGSAWAATHRQPLPAAVTA